jgi:hypothetical protein
MFAMLMIRLLVLTIRCWCLCYGVGDASARSASKRDFIVGAASCTRSVRDALSAGRVVCAEESLPLSICTATRSETLQTGWFLFLWRRVQSVPGECMFSAFLIATSPPSGVCRIGAAAAAKQAPGRKSPVSSATAETLVLPCRSSHLAARLGQREDTGFSQILSI